LHYQFSLAKRLNYLKEEEIIESELILNECGKVLGALIRSLKNKK
jgi:hypothetical protein